MSCYTYNIILKLLMFGCLAIMRRTTKLIQGGHRGLQDYRLLRFYVFYVFQNPKSRDLLRFLPYFVCFLKLCPVQILQDTTRGDWRWRWRPATKPQRQNERIDTNRERQNCSAINVLYGTCRLRWYCWAFLRRVYNLNTVGENVDFHFSTSIRDSVTTRWPPPHHARGVYTI